MADNKKKFTLQAYDIENEEIGKAYSDLQEKLKALIPQHYNLTLFISS